MGVNHGEAGHEPKIWSGDANANCPSRFCRVSKFEAPDCLHYNAVKTYQLRDSNRVFTTSKKYVFNVHQITIQIDRTFNIFGEDKDKKYRSKITKTLHFK